MTAGDANYDGRLTIADVTFTIARIFSGGPPPNCTDAADANGDGNISIGDVTHMLARIFNGGPPAVCQGFGL
jgi:hypothetical protein